MIPKVGWGPSGMVREEAGKVGRVTQRGPEVMPFLLKDGDEMLMGTES